MKTPDQNVLRPVLAAALVLALSAAVCFSATYTWDNDGADGNWNAATNWNPDGNPTVGDTVVFPEPMPDATSNILLAANQVVDFFQNRSASNLVWDGQGSYSLTINAGMNGNDYRGNNPNCVLAADVVLGSSQTWQMSGGWGSIFTIRGAISDGGNGYGITFANDGNDAWAFEGANTYSGETVLVNKNYYLRGADGALLNSSVRFENQSGNECTLWVDNRTVANGNRMADAGTNTFTRNGGRIWLYGHDSNAVAEAAGFLNIDQGMAYIRSEYHGGDLELGFSGVDRKPGTMVAFDYSGGTRGVNNSIRMAGASNVLNGMWYPWAYHAGWEYAHMRVDANHTLLPMTGGDYPELADTGNNPAQAYEITGTDLTLTSDEEIYVLRTFNGNPQTLSLASNDLTIAGGSIVLANNGDKTIDSTGGTLIFGGNEVMIFCYAPNDVITISAPIAATGSGSKHLVIRSGGADDVVLSGEDYIGVYDSIVGDSNSDNIELGGPSDRTVTNYLAGEFDLNKSGTGTLTLNGEDLRGGYVTRVNEGTLVVGHVNALAFLGYTDNTILINSNGILRIAAGISWNSRFTFNEGATIGGSGELLVNKTVPANAGVSPGMSVGQFTTRDLTFDDGSFLDWELGAGTTTAGVDYDLLSVNGVVEFPAGGTVNVFVSDASGGATSPNNAVFTILEWTGTDPNNIPAWNIINQSPLDLITTNAQVTIDYANKRVLMSNLLATAAIDLIVQPSSLAVDEDGGTDQFTVELRSAPTNNVVVDITSDAPGEATVDTARLTFTSGDWNVPQAATVTGVPDGDLGTDYATITVSIDSDATHDDAYDAVSDKHVDIELIDDDAEFSVDPALLSITENGAGDSFSVVLDAQPLSPVVLDVTSADTGEATVDKAQLTFTTGNYANPQAVTVLPVDDSAFGDTVVTITVSVNDALSADSYDNAADKSITVVIDDDELIVSNNNDSGPGSLREIVAQAPTGAEVGFAPAIGTIVLTGGVVNITRDMTIAGPDPAGQAIDGGGSDRIFNINYNSTLGVEISGLTLTNAGGASIVNGGAIYNFEPLTLSNCVFAGNMIQPTAYGQGGGAVYHNSGGELRIVECSFVGNISDGEPADGRGDGSAVWVNGGGDVTVSDTDFVRNLASGEGTFYVNSGDRLVAFDACTFTSNRVHGGGAIWSQAACSMTVSNCVFTFNRADWSPDQSDTGVMHLEWCDGLISDCLFADNYAADERGVFFVDDTIWNSHKHQVVFERCNFFRNHAVDTVGVGWVGAAGHVLMNECNLGYNSVRDDSAGALRTTGDGLLTVFNSCIYSNSAGPTNNWGDWGGALQAQGRTKLVNTTISGNTAGHRGGAILYDTDVNGRHQLRNCTIYGNRCLYTPDAGVYHYNAGYLEIFNSIISANTGLGGDLDIIDGSPTDIERIDHCIYDFLAGTVITAVDNMVTNPMVKALGDYGGLTLTHALESGSPAYNAGVPANELRFVYPDISVWIASVTGITGVAESNTDENGFQHLSIVGVGGGDQYQLRVYKDSGRSAGSQVAHATWTRTTSDSVLAVAVVPDNASGLGGFVDIRTRGYTWFNQDDWRWQLEWMEATNLSEGNTDGGLLYYTLLDVGGGLYRIDFFDDVSRTHRVAYSDDWAPTPADNIASNVVLNADSGSGIGGTIRVSEDGPTTGNWTVRHCGAFDYVSVLVTELQATDQRAGGYSRITRGAVDIGAFEYGSRPPIIPRPMMLIIK